MLAAQFPETVTTQPELLARHYTEADLQVEALCYWHQAGQYAMERSAYAEAFQHLTTGLELLATVPETPERHYDSQRHATSHPWSARNAGVSFRALVSEDLWPLGYPDTFSESVRSEQCK